MQTKTTKCWGFFVCLFIFNTFLHQETQASSLRVVNWEQSSNNYRGQSFTTNKSRFSASSFGSGCGFCAYISPLTHKQIQ